MLVTVENISGLQQYADFKVGIPDYLPEGYHFNRAVFYKDEEGTVSGNYVNLYFTRAGTETPVFMQQRLADEETAFGLSTDLKVEDATVNGAAAALIGGTSIKWEAGGVLYSLSGKELGRQEILKIAESVR
ncbi:MAG: hypothetical protein K0R57_4600 [Paenibacillaceae bacterium]|jgi:hypothetical protein|nr:hypothetical protein [Paenibacillaceae bacterium]